MIGLLTFHWADDCGAMLQAYALKRRLGELGGAVEVIPYAPLRLRGRYYWFAPQYRLKDGRAQFQLRQSMQNWRRHPVPSRNFVRRRRMMDRFRRTYLTADPSLHRIQDINLERYSHVFVGSDQIWNPEITLGLEDAYLGNIPNRKNCRFIAYAASLGEETLPEEYRERFSACVGAAFADISLRERSAIPFVEGALGRRVTDALDPALLLERREWEEIAVPPEEEGYVLVYQTEYSEPLLEYARRVAQKLGKQVISVSYYERNRTPAWAEQRTDIGPAEFVGYIRNAACVMTNSFHGTAFSILYEKQFVVFPHSTTSARMENLLEKLDLQARRMTRPFPVADEAVWEPVDWPEASRRLEKERERSLAFLRRNLNRGG